MRYHERMARAEGFQIGDRFGPYELVSHVGSGGFASVWLARRTGLAGFEAKVAIKFIRTDIGTDPVFEKMFIDEAKLAALIHHPNVVTIFELGSAENTLYMVMEYVAGRSLAELRNAAERAGRVIPIPIVMRILADTCAGLHAAHELTRDGKSLEVIHRDVSPENILVSRAGLAKLIDFGVAKANDRIVSTATGLAKGKVRYMPPEQAMAKAVDRRADIWAVGATAFDLIEGRPVFDGPNDLARLHALVGSTPVPALGESVPRAFAKVIERALRRDPDERWSTAAEMRTAIEAAMEAEGTHVTPDAVATFFSEWLDRADVESDDRIVVRGKLARPGGTESTAELSLDGETGTSDHGAGVLRPASKPAVVETVGGLDSSLVARALPARVRATTVGGIALVLGVAVGVGLWRTSHPSLLPPAATSPSDVAVTAPPPPAPTPTVVPEPAAPEVAPSDPTTVAIRASAAAPPEPAPRTKVPRRGPGRKMAIPASAPPSTAPPRPKYDDTIQ